MAGSSLAQAAPLCQLDVGQIRRSSKGESVKVLRYRSNLREKKCPRGQNSPGSRFFKRPWFCLAHLAGCRSLLGSAAFLGPSLRMLLLTSVAVSMISLLRSSPLHWMIQTCSVLSSPSNLLLLLLLLLSPPSNLISVPRLLLLPSRVLPSWPRSLGAVPLPNKKKYTVEPNNIKSLLASSEPLVTIRNYRQAFELLNWQNKLFRIYRGMADFGKMLSYAPRAEWSSWNAILVGVTVTACRKIFPRTFISIVRRPLTPAPPSNNLDKAKIIVCFWNSFNI